MSKVLVSSSHLGAIHFGVYLVSYTVTPSFLSVVPIYEAFKKGPRIKMHMILKFHAPRKGILVFHNSVLRGCKFDKSLKKFLLL